MDDKRQQPFYARGAANADPYVGAPAVVARPRLFAEKLSNVSIAVEELPFKAG